MFLERIVAAKQEEVAVYRNHVSLSELKKQAAEMPPARDFLGRCGVSGRLHQRRGVAKGQPKV